MITHGYVWIKPVTYRAFLIHRDDGWVWVARLDRDVLPDAVERVHEAVRMYDVTQNQH